MIFNFGDWQQNLMRVGLRNYELTLHGLIIVYYNACMAHNVVIYQPKSKLSS